MTKQIKATLDEIVEAVMDECLTKESKKIIKASDPHIAWYISIRGIKTALEKFVVEEDECERYKTALKNISNPIEFMKSNLSEGEQLDGLMAINMLSDASFYRTIANKALTTPKKGGDDGTGH